MDSPWSHPERAAHRLLREAGITGWSGNTSVMVDDSVRFPDILFEAIHLILEIDGRAHHNTSEAFDADRRRQNQLVGAGWTVLRFTANQIADDPKGFVATVRAMILRLGG